jgi:purine-binding chemotaxis protein CheW
MMTTNTERSFCTFRIEGRLYGVDILEVKEVTTETTSTRIAHAPDEVRGLVNIRGHIYLALDSRRLLGLPPAQITGDSRLVLFKASAGASFGIIVDAIAEIRTSTSAAIEDFASSQRSGILSNLSRVDLISALCKLPDELLVILEPRRFLSVVEQQLTAA